jgi:acetolactate synthase-1/2/3 large subunit
MRSAECPRVCDKQGQHCRPYIPDFVSLAAAYGIPAYRASRYEDVEKVLKQGLAEKGPALMEFLVLREENVMPMVPAGKPLGEMIDRA